MVIGSKTPDHRLERQPTKERNEGPNICIMKLGASVDGAAQLTFWRVDYGKLVQLNVTATGEPSSDFGGSGLWNWA